MKVLIFFLWLIHWLPLWIVGPLGNLLGALAFICLQHRRHITLTNLRLCFPHMPETKRRTLARQHFQAYGRSVLERTILWWAPVARLKKLIHIESDFPLNTLHSSRDNPLILLCPHFVCLEIPGIALVLNSSLSVCSLYTKQKNDVFDAALLKGRSRFRPVKLFTRSQGIKPIIRAMRDGLPFIMLPDMDFGMKDAEFVPFFGVPAATLTATARLAQATGAQVIPMIATFLPRYRGWKVHFYPAWDNDPGNDILLATQKMNAFLEARILEAPAQYFWTHRRFKTRPAGFPDVYKSSD